MSPYEIAGSVHASFVGVYCRPKSNPHTTTLAGASLVDPSLGFGMAFSLPELATYLCNTLG